MNIYENEMVRKIAGEILQEVGEELTGENITEAISNWYGGIEEVQEEDGSFEEIKLTTKMRWLAGLPVIV